MCMCGAEVESKNHLKENMRRIREIQKNVHQVDDESKQPVKALWKLSRFECIPSRVKEQLEVSDDVLLSLPTAAHCIVDCLLSV